MIAGVTGSREKPTGVQVRNCRQWIEDNKPQELHHGGCVGADEAVAQIGACHTPKCVCHPPLERSLASQYAIQISDQCLPDKPYEDRNQDIVNICDILLAMPKTMKEEQRSGTWMTVRMARRAKKPIVFFWPDGTVTTENDNGEGLT
jgi:hypothetical protein